MSASKIEIKIGEITFSGEGEPAWLSEQLDKILDRAEDLMALAPVINSSPPHGGNSDHEEADLSGHDEIASKPLGIWLRDRNADTNQNLKFLATAVWVESKGQNRLQTKDVTGALSNANQKRLGNATECLNQNVKQGFCEKEGKQFYVTEEGKRKLDIN
ncbi:hypothetical protein [Halomonas sp. GD1P12]|uniref:hypothetical protein n=1 Tax=Halomonas sp. GD1P12 TaxID=2982691 RepID=UPI0021E3E660|nr:hypothetical protein [Halomonas sp. GD1P12]UYG01256.1 hypothetical protein OCT39_06805 [Halomonas sp. GD1P12]